MNYLIEIIFAAFCIITAAYVGTLRKTATSGNPTLWTYGLVKTKISALLFDLSILGLAVLFSFFIHRINLAIALAIIFRLFYGMASNYFQLGSLAYLDRNKIVDNFLLRILGHAAAVYQALILMALLILVNIFWL
jgi:hypothetical protein